MKRRAASTVESLKSDSSRPSTSRSASSNNIEVSQRAKRYSCTKKLQSDQISWVFQEKVWVSRRRFLHRERRHQEAEAKEEGDSRQGGGQRGELWAQGDPRGHGAQHSLRQLKLLRYVAAPSQQQIPGQYCTEYFRPSVSNRLVFEHKFILRIEIFWCLQNCRI